MNFRLLLYALPCLFLGGCTYDKPVPAPGQQDTKGYPNEVAAILVNKCATSGCHNDASKGGANGLSFSSWSRMFEGGNNGPAVIPFRSDQSTLLLFSNTYKDLGLSLLPRMPLTRDSLTRQEIITLKNWIEKGAPDKDGFVMFSDNATRKKIYVTNQGCDLVDVFDAATGTLMRAIDVGLDPQAVESPHQVKVSPDGQYWYVVFYNASVVQRFRTSDDSYAGAINIGSGTWNTLAISPDSKKAFVVDWSGNGKVVYLDLENMTKMLTYPVLKTPHGVMVNKAFTKLYITAQTGNYIYKIDITDPQSPDDKQVVLQPGQPVTYASTLDPHEILFSPDESEYYVTCQKTNEVRVMKTSNDSLLAIISTGSYPQEMSVSEQQPYLFVTCTEDSVNVPLYTKGSVAVINYQSHTLIKNVYGFYQPHGIGVDDARNKVYIASRNQNYKGPAPHHTTVCGGRNGFMQVMDLSTLNLISTFKVELSVDPYSIAVRK